jgi:hypothetical protein
MQPRSITQRCWSTSAYAMMLALALPFGVCRVTVSRSLSVRSIPGFGLPRSLCRVTGAAYRRVEWSHLAVFGRGRSLSPFRVSAFIRERMTLAFGVCRVSCNRIPSVKLQKHPGFRVPALTASGGGCCLSMCRVVTSRCVRVHMLDAPGARVHAARARARQRSRERYCS